jgi:hypothetical protein
MEHSIKILIVAFFCLILSSCTLQTKTPDTIDKCNCSCLKEKPAKKQDTKTYIKIPDISDPNRLHFPEPEKTQ